MNNWLSKSYILLKIFLKKKTIMQIHRREMNIHGWKLHYAILRIGLLLRGVLKIVTLIGLFHLENLNKNRTAQKPTYWIITSCKVNIVIFFVDILLLIFAVSIMSPVCFSRYKCCIRICNLFWISESEDYRNEIIEWENMKKILKVYRRKILVLNQNQVISCMSKNIIIFLRRF